MLDSSRNEAQAPFPFPKPNYTIGVPPHFIAPDLDLFEWQKRLELWFADADY